MFRWWGVIINTLIHFINLLKYENYSFSEIDCSILEKSIIDSSNFKLSLISDLVIFDDINIDYLTRNGNTKMACNLLSKLDGVKQSNGVSVRIFTTNENIEDIDPAFLRPGRIDEIICFEPPDDEYRGKVYNSWEDIFKTVTEDVFIYNTQDFSYAELDSIKSHMASRYLDNNKCTAEDFYECMNIVNTHKEYSNDSKVMGFNTKGK
jgi:SpoVK/Ycf46/Vps4 family AAA+-type ATPase